MRKVKKARHDLYLSDEGDNKNKVVIKGNDLNLRWFNNSILVWTGDKDLPCKILEMVEGLLKEINDKS